MSNLSQFYPGPISIGGAIVQPEAGDMLTFEEGNVYLRSGSTASASTYNRAALRDWMKVFGSQLGTLPVTPNAGATRIATDTTGQYVVVVYGDATNVLKSSDYGATFTAVAHNMPVGQPNDVIFALGRFILAGNTTSAFGYSQSNNYATTFTFTSAGNTTCGSAASATANTTRLAASSTTIVAIANSGNASNALGTSTTGTSFTAQNASFAPGFIVNVAFSSASGLFVFAPITAGANYYTSANGSTGSFTTRTYTSAIQSIVGLTPKQVIANPSVFLYISSTGAMSSSDGINWTLKNLPRGVSASGVQSNLLTVDGSDFVMGDSSSAAAGGAYAFFVSTDNAANWKRYWLNYSVASGTANIVVSKVGTRLLAVTNGTSTATMTSSGYPNSPDLIGSKLTFDATGSVSNTQTSMPIYLRIA